MRRILFGCCLAVIAAATLALAWAEHTRAPLPWRGALTGVAWRELASGQFGIPHCRRSADFPRLALPGQVLPLLPFRERLPTHATFECEAVTRDSTLWLGI